MRKKFKNVSKDIQEKVAAQLFKRATQTFRPNLISLLSSWVHRVRPLWNDAYTIRLEARIRELNAKFYTYKPRKR